jgi:hypothetical protein
MYGCDEPLLYRTSTVTVEVTVKMNVAVTEVTETLEIATLAKTIPLC